VAFGLLGAEGDQLPARQGADLLKTDIMGVFAHPDDETGMIATLARYSHGEAKVVANIYCTRGEGGGNMVGTQGGAALGILREAELRDCLSRAGVRYCYFLDQLDWAYTESVAATLRKWGQEETLRRLVRHVRALRPDVILTMNPAPMPGQHGHHQAAGLLATEAFDAAADPLRFTEQLSKEGLAVWQVRKLYYGGGSGEFVATITTTNLLPNGKTPGDVAAEALVHHRSQAFGNFGNSPWLRRPQVFTLVKSAVPYRGGETDLLLGQPWAGADLKRQPIGQPPEPTGPIELRFVPRPAVANYRAWVAAQGIGHVAARLEADIPVVVGESTPVKLELANRSSERLSGEVRFSGTDGWRITPEVKPYQLGAGRTETLAVSVTAPAGLLSDGEIRASIRARDGEPHARARLHPVPRVKVPRVREALTLGGTAGGWDRAVAGSISPTNLVQGKVAGEADSSAQFRLAHDGKTLFVEVDVTDDQIVSNIEPNDIKGHWRSDSVEICLDPVGGAEDTMGCYKVGIFPFDTQGKVRAARDADAQQGLVEETAPKTRLTSRRTAGGYVIQAAIPFDEIGGRGAAGRRLGFNIIVYDGDKAGAAPGENINKSRIAWSPRSGVQGRPEDWGRIDLE
jgi:LmbE family N-acetylglucosaminyl deacetylase